MSTASDNEILSVLSRGETNKAVGVIEFRKMKALETLGATLDKVLATLDRLEAATLKPVVEDAPTPKLKARKAEAEQP